MDARTPMDQDGTALAAVVAVMDRLRSPGGCPWDAEQTHESLVRYLLEEAHELAEAIETGDRAGMREELGDVLLQVVFHARVAAEDPADPFTIDDVAADLVAKLRRRHPHVFAGAEVTDLHAQWAAIKQEEKQRASVLDGIPPTLGALAHAQKVLGRTDRAGLMHLLPPAPAPEEDPVDLGQELLALVERARRAGIDAEGALRAAVRDVSAAVRAAEPPPTCPAP
jgi:XTP/dITP diphosphohydrolase